MSDETSFGIFWAASFVLTLAVWFSRREKWSDGHLDPMFLMLAPVFGPFLLFWAVALTWEP